MNLFEEQTIKAKEILLQENSRRVWSDTKTKRLTAEIITNVMIAVYSDILINDTVLFEYFFRKFNYIDREKIKEKLKVAKGRVNEFKY